MKIYPCCLLGSPCKRHTGVPLLPAVPPLPLEKRRDGPFIWRSTLGTRQDGDRAEYVINTVMYLIACVRSLGGPESYLAQAIPVTPEERETQKG